jgi:hypothetical protein
MNTACASGGPGGGCLVAQGSGAAPAGLTLHTGAATLPGIRALSGSEAAFRFRTSLFLPHDGVHTLRVSLDGSEVMGFSCNGRVIRLQAPGAAPFRWEVFHGTQRVGGGSSSGDAVDVANPPHLAGPGGGPLLLTVQQRDPRQLAGADDAWCRKYGCLQLTVAHGEHRIVVMPQLYRNSPFAMERLGLSVAGVPAFAVAAVDLDRGAR